jgi:uncharacterized protein (TIGR03067 family)
MRTLAIFLAAISGLLLQTHGRGDAPKEESKLLAGTWLPVEAELGGKKFTDEQLNTITLTLTDGKYTVKVGEALDKGTYKIDPAVKPRAIDITGTEGPNKGRTFLCIYELTGDSLRVCYDLDGKNRPTEFKTEKNLSRFLVTYKREKP